MSYIAVVGMTVELATGVRTAMGLVVVAAALSARVTTPGVPPQVLTTTVLKTPGPVLSCVVATAPD
jgi:hypothetical protein